MSPTSDFEEAKSVLGQAERYDLLPRHSGMRVLLRVWAYPTFTPCMSWTVIIASSVFYVRRLTWDQSRHTTGTFAFFGSESLLPKEIWSPFAAELDRQTIQPFVPINGIFRDGTIFGIERISDCVTARLTWWQYPPPGWEALARWHTAVIAAFQSLLPVHHIQRP